MPSKRNILLFIISSIFLGMAIFIASKPYPYLLLGKIFVASILQQPDDSESELSFLQSIPKCQGCNLLVVSLDTFRLDHLGFQRGAEKSLTPHLDAIAEKSIYFSNAWTNAYYTTPSHMTLFTGLYPQRHGVFGLKISLPRHKRRLGDGAELDKSKATLAEILKKNNYTNYWYGPQNYRNLDFSFGFSRGFDSTATPLFDREMGLQESLIDKGIEGTFKEVFKQANQRAPFFIFAHSYVNHLPYLAENLENTGVPYDREALLTGFQNAVMSMPPAFFNKHLPDRGRRKKFIKHCGVNFELNKCIGPVIDVDSYLHLVGQWQLKQATVRIKSKNEKKKSTELKKFRQAYAEGIRRVDRQMGIIWQQLTEQGLLKNTLVVILSDHGEELFDHGLGNHSSFYNHTARVPLIVYHPHLEKGKKLDLNISLVDVYPSLLDILGLEKPNKVDGKNIFQRDLDADSFKYVYGFSLGDSYVTDGEYKYIRSWNGIQSFYNFRHDRRERKNLLNSPLAVIRSRQEDLSLRLKLLDLEVGTQ